MTPKNPNPPPVPHEEYDPFSYPRLYPSGWNLENGSKSSPLSASKAPEPEPKKNGSSLPSWYEPFHDLRTFPSGWDLP